MDNERNPLRHLDLASQHVFMQILGWMWSMVFSLSYLSIYQFGLTWLPHMLIIGGAFFTVALFKEGEKMALQAAEIAPLSHGANCVWNLEKEA